METPPPPPPPPPPPEISKRLHNFTLPYLRWGHQRFLRCVKPSHHHSPPSLSSDPKLIAPSRTSTSYSARRFASGGEIKLGLDLRYEGKLKVSFLGSGGYEDGVVAARPWNLRTRRAACNEPWDESTRLVDAASRLESGAKRVVDGDGYKEKNEKVKFSVSLLREEIEEDFAAMIGKRPPRRPKKRPRIVQRQLNSLFPGLWLAEEVTADSYNVPETLET